MPVVPPVSKMYVGFPANAFGTQRLAGQRASRPDRRYIDRADRTSRSQQPREREMAADTRSPSPACQERR